MSKKLAVCVLLASTAVAAFAITGDGKDKKKTSRKSLLKPQAPVVTPGSFTLKSGYQFRGSRVFRAEEKKYINLNTVVSYQKGHTSYIMPLKKKVLLNNRVVFNPNAATRR